MWIGEDIAFISDRNDGAANLYLYDAHTHAVRQLTHETVWDVRNAGAYEHTIVYEAGGQLKTLDVTERRSSAAGDPSGVAVPAGAAAVEERRQEHHFRASVPIR